MKLDKRDQKKANYIKEVEQVELTQKQAQRLQEHFENEGYTVETELVNPNRKDSKVSFKISLPEPEEKEETKEEQPMIKTDKISYDFLEKKENELTSELDRQDLEFHSFNEGDAININIPFNNDGDKGLITVEIFEDEEKYHLHTAKQADEYAQKNLKKIKSVKAVMTYIRNHKMDMAVSQ